jgi:hypothetical protein
MKSTLVATFGSAAGLLVGAIVLPAVPPSATTISTVQSPATGTVGSTFTDTATVTDSFGNLVTTGTVTFNFSSLFTDTETVNAGTVTAAYMATVTGSFNWVATYSSGGVSVTAPSEPVTVIPATPSISTSQLPPMALVGNPIVDTATLSGGFNPTGTITFNLYNNSSGSGAPLFTSTVNAAATATSLAYVATVPGTDYWVATYNGDSDNNSVTSGVSAEPVTITPLVTTPVPEPASFALLGSGILGLIFARRRQAGVGAVTQTIRGNTV